MIAFCFGALLEALAGFGTPVAICGIMLVGLGLKPVKAAAVALVADTAPVAFGAIAIPITTLAQVTGLPVHDLGQMVGRQTPFLALIIPFVLVFMVDGRRGMRETWPAALTAGVVFAVMQFAMSNYVQRPAHRHHRVARLGGRGRGAAAGLAAGSAGAGGAADRPGDRRRRGQRPGDGASHRAPSAAGGCRRATC